MQDYADTSYPPVGSILEYVRGDGAKVTLKVENATELPPLQPHSTGIRMKKRTSASLVLPPNANIRINPRANIQTRPAQQQPGKLIAAPTITLDSAIDHPTVGGKFTAFILFYGGDEHHELHHKCLSSFLQTVPAHRVDLRVGSNALGPKSLAMIEEQVQRGRISKHYRHTENAYKYPVMREMFYDDTHPIQTKWILWFDDDSICDVDPNWLTALSMCINQYHKDKEAHMIGATFVWPTTQRQREILSSRPWYRNQPWRAFNGKPDPVAGNKIIFTVGGFWALTTEAMRAADIPDLGTGLLHNGGDWQIGEQLYQAGYTNKMFNAKKQFVRTSSVERRGETTPLIDKRGVPPTVAPPVRGEQPKKIIKLP